MKNYLIRFLLHSPKKKTDQEFRKRKIGRQKNVSKKNGIKIGEVQEHVQLNPALMDYRGPTIYASSLDKIYIYNLKDGS